MKKLLALLTLVILSSVACPGQQNFMTVTASNILTTLSGQPQPLPSGSIIFQPTDLNGNPVGYQVGGGGQLVSFPTVCSIVAGAITGSCQLANVSITNPMNVCFNTTVKDGSNRVVLGGPGSGYNCVQPQTTNSWCASGICNFDSFVPSIPGAALALLGPARTFSLGGVYASTCPSGQAFNGLADGTGRFSCVSTSGGGGGAVSAVFGRTGAVAAQTGDYTVAQVTGAAPSFNPSFTGTITLPITGINQCLHVNSSGQISGTGIDCGSGGGGAVASVFGRSGVVIAAIGDYTVSQVTGAAPSASPAFSGAPTAPTATVGTNTTQLATTAFVLANQAVASVFGRTGAVVAAGGDYSVAQVTGAAPLASPALSGTPTAPNATVSTNTTQIATTAYVLGQLASTLPVMDGAAAAGTSLLTSRADHVHPSDTSRAPTASPVFTGTITTPITNAPALSTGGGGVVVAATTSGSGALALVTSPALLGTPTAPTAAPGTNTTQLSTTAFVTAAIAAGVSPGGTAGGDLTGTYPNPNVARVNGVTMPISGTVLGTNGSGQIVTATTTGTGAIVALAASPSLTGTPVAPTAGVSTNTTQVATTAFVLGQVGTATPLINGTAAVGTSLLYARQDHVHPIDTTRAPLASPNFTGVPSGPTATPGTSSTQFATTAFVAAAIVAPGVSTEFLYNNGSGVTSPVTGSTVDGSFNVHFPANVDIASGCYSIGGVCIPSTPTTIPGINGQVMYKFGGALAASSGFTFDQSTGNIVVGGTVTAAGFISTGAGSWFVQSPFGAATHAGVAGQNLTTFDSGTGDLFCSANGVTPDYCRTSFSKIITGGNANALSITSGGSLIATGTGTISATSVTGFSPTAGKTLSLTNTLTLSGTDGSTINAVTGGTVSYVGSFPATAHLIGTNGSNLPIVATAVDVAAVQYVAAAGAVNVLTATLAPVPASLTTGLQVRILPNLANTTTTPTLNVNALGAKTITKLGTAALAAGDITTTAIAILVYDGTEWQLQNPQTGTGGGAGTVTTTGSPASGNLSKFSGAASITNADLTGDVGTTGTLVTTLASVGSPGSCGDATHSCVITFDAKGRETAQTSTAISAVGGAVGAAITSSTTVTVTNPTAATDTQLTELSLPGGYLNLAGQAVVIHGGGVYSTGAASSPTITISAKLCTVSGCGSGTVVPLSAIASGAASASATTNAPWNFTVSAVTNAAGATGNLIVKGSPGLAVDLSNVVSAAATVYPDVNTAVSSNIDLTAPLFLDYTVALSATGASNIVKQQYALIAPQTSAPPPDVISYQVPGTTSAVTAVSGVDTTLYTVTLPANLFCPGCGVHILAAARHQTGTTSTNWQLKFGSASNFNLTTNTDGTASQRFDVNIMEDPVIANTQYLYQEGGQRGSTLITNSPGPTTYTQTTSGTIVLTFSINQAATETFTPQEFLVTRFQH